MRTLVLLASLLATAGLAGAAVTDGGGGDAPDVPASLANATPEQLEKFFASPAYQKLHRSDSEFLTDVYETVLHRAPDQAGLGDWMGAMKGMQSKKGTAATEAWVLKKFLSSDEYKKEHPAAAQPGADQGNNPVPTAKSDVCAPIYKIADKKGFNGPAFFTSAYYKDLKRSDPLFLRDVYCLMLQRPPDAKGLQVWLGSMQKSEAEHKPENEIRIGVVNQFAHSPEYLAAHPAPTSDRGRIAGNSIFDGTGLFVNDPHVFDALYYPSPSDPQQTGLKLLQTGKVKWISLQIDNGPSARADNVAAVQQGWVTRWKQLGFKVGFWGVPRGPDYNARNMDEQQLAGARATITPSVQADAQRAAQLTTQLGGDFYLADLEGPFQDGEGDPAMNQVYVDAFNKAAPAGLARALSTMGRVALDMNPWIKTGWDVLPQAYWNSYAQYQPSLCVDFFKSTGWAVDRIHPTIATYTGEGQNLGATLPQYASDLATRPTKGFSYYLPESYMGTNATMWQQLGSMSR